MIQRKPFFYLRHGQTDWNHAGRFQGQTDIPLNDIGRAQANAAKPLLTGHPITQIFASPLSRARETADIVNTALDLPITNHAGLQEVSFGEMEGEKNDMTDYNRRWRLENYTPKGAESFPDFTKRILATVADLLMYDGTPLLVAHGGVFWPIQYELGLVVDGNLPNAQPLHVFPTDTGWDWRPVEASVVS